MFCFADIYIYIFGLDADYWSGLIFKAMGFPVDFFPESIKEKKRRNIEINYILTHTLTK